MTAQSDQDRKKKERTCPEAEMDFGTAACSGMNRENTSKILGKCHG